MSTNTARRSLALIAAAALSATVLTSCSSGGSEAEPTATTTEIVIEDTLPTETATEEIVATGAAAMACEVYFEIDLLNSAYAGGVVKQGDMTEKQVKDELLALVDELNVQAAAAVDDGSADPKMLANAKRMEKILGKLKKKEDLKDLSKPAQKRFATASLRVQNSCDRAGIPLPAENVTARTAAGL
jgi:ABC-type Fe3+-hydroxamate transport system substrate-binding protein